MLQKRKKKSFMLLTIFFIMFNPIPSHFRHWFFFFLLTLHNKHPWRKKNCMKGEKIEHKSPFDTIPFIMSYAYLLYVSVLLLLFLELLILFCCIPLEYIYEELNEIFIVLTQLFGIHWMKFGSSLLQEWEVISWELNFFRKIKSFICWTWIRWIWFFCLIYEGVLHYLRFHCNFWLLRWPGVQNLIT